MLDSEHLWQLVLWFVGTLIAMGISSFWAARRASEKVFEMFRDAVKEDLEAKRIADATEVTAINARQTEIRDHLLPLQVAIGEIKGMLSKMPGIPVVRHIERKEE